MFFAQFFYDLSTACRNVAENARHACLPYKLINERLRKAVRIGWKRAVEYDAGHFPMTGGRVLPIGFQSTLAVTTTGFFNLRHAAQRTNITEAETLKIRQLHLSRFADVPESI